MHILFLTDNYPPEVNAPASRTHEHCREWVRLGHKVTVITCVPNFPRGIVYDGYRNQLWSLAEIDGVEVVRVWSYISANSGFLKRTLDYISFGFVGAIAGLRIPEVHVVVGTSPQFFTALGAYFVGLFRKIPFVFELRDIWPESIKAVGAMSGDSMVFHALEALELFLYRRAALVVSVTKSFKRNLIARGIDERKIKVVTNGVDSSRFSPGPRSEALVERYGLEGRVVFGYVGTHGMAHALETLLEAAAELEREGLANSFKLLLVGDGARRSDLIRRAVEMNLDTVEFVDSVPKDDVVDYWRLLDVSIIHLRDTPLFQTVIPSKLFECMGMGIPVLLGVEGESAEILDRAGAGRGFKPEDPSSLAEAMRRMIDSSEERWELGKRGRIAARDFDRSGLAEEMVRHLETTSSVRER